MMYSCTFDVKMPLIACSDRYIHVGRREGGGGGGGGGVPDSRMSVHKSRPRAAKQSCQNRRHSKK